MDEYLKAKKAAKTAIYFVKRGAQTEPFASNNNNHVRNDDGKLTVTVNDKLKSWQSHYQKLLDVEFP